MEDNLIIKIILLILGAGGIMYAHDILVTLRLKRQVAKGKEEIKKKKQELQESKDELNKLKENYTDKLNDYRNDDGSSS